MSLTYEHQRRKLETYFDRTASEAWARLTSDAPVSRIRQTVREGRDAMRATLLSWLPDDLRGARVLDAGCGTGALALAAAARGADVVAVDIAPTLIGIARNRTPAALAGRIDWRAGDMLDPALGRFDYAVAMDSLIHYRAEDTARAVERLAGRTGQAVALTFAPRTRLLAAMHLAGRLFPRSDRSPAIQPVAEARLRRLVDALPGCRAGATHRVARGFYISQALEVRTA